MYRVLGRERISGARFGRYLVEFSLKWPEGVEYLYLVAPFTSYFPGRVELRREGERGRVVVSLWEGSYPYRFSSTCGFTVLDVENPSRVMVRLWPDSGVEEEFSLAEVGVADYATAAREGRLVSELLVHDERDPSFVSRYLGFTILRFKAPTRLLDRVYVEINDGKRVEMQRYVSTELVDYFQGVVSGEVKGYRFLLDAGGERLYYGQNGLGDESYIRPGEIVGLDEPYWYVGSTYYLIFPDSFTRSKVSIAGGSRPRARLGGSLRDVAESLDYIASLGVEAVYLTPIYRSVSYHRYDVIDHTEVDEDLGGWEGWSRLVKEAERRNIRIVVDIVAHHVSPCSPEFLRALSEGGEYKDWFRFFSSFDEREAELLRTFTAGGCREFPAELRGRMPFYETFICNWGMPKLNYSNQRVVERLCQVASFWLTQGASGLRIDVGHALPDAALKQLYSTVKGLKRDAPVILEVSKGVVYYPYGVTADSAMNYDLREALLDFIVYRNTDAVSFVRRLKELYARIPVFAASSMYNLLGSHDTPRIATLAERCGSGCLRLLYVVLFALPGSPSIYYGDEVGMRGGGDPDNRLPMLWDEEKWDRDLQCLIRRLAFLRRSLAPLRLGFFDARVTNEGAVAIMREWRGEEVMVVFNAGEKEISAPIDGYATVLASDSAGEKVLKPYSWRILHKVKKP